MIMRDGTTLTVCNQIASCVRKMGKTVGCGFVFIRLPTREYVKGCQM